MDRSRLMDYLLEEAEENYRYFQSRQIRAEGSPVDGSVPEPDRLCPPFPRNVSSRLLEMTALWINPKSRYYADPEFVPMARRGLAFIKREQRPSGNIDLWDCNFDSAPDSGFLLWDLIPLYRLLEKGAASLPEKAAGEAGLLRGVLKPLILSVLEGLRTGGFHTANHRWVNASSLAAGYRLFGDKACLEKARQYLAEGIDCNGDGEYSERSAIYNAVNNQAMITLFEELGEERYLSYVQRNLSMLIHYFDGDGSLFTGNSTRQDRGKKVFAGRYLYQYLYIARRLGDPEAARMAEYIAAGYLKTRRRPAPDCLPFLTLHPEVDFPPAGEAAAFTLPDYNRYFRSSGIVRYRKGGFGYSLLHDNPAWLCFNAGAISAALKTSLGFFGYGNVKISALEPTEEGYRFSFRGEGWYFEPLDQAPGELTDFRAEDHAVRRKQYPNHSALALEIRHREQGIDIAVTASGVGGVHYCFELVLPAGLPFSGDHVALLPRPGDFILLKDGGFTLRDGADALRFDGAFADTELFATSRNAEGRGAESFTVYMNGTAPFSRTLSLRCS